MRVWTHANTLSTQNHQQRLLEMLTSNKERPTEPAMVQAVFGLPKPISESIPDGAMVLHDPSRP